MVLVLVLILVLVVVVVVVVVGMLHLITTIGTCGAMREEVEGSSQIEGMPETLKQGLGSGL